MGAVLGDLGFGFISALGAGGRFLASQSEAELLAQLGWVVDAVPAWEGVGKGVLQESFGGNLMAAPDDLLAGRGLFYLTEQRRLFLDCTSGHYQMLWGYNHPGLCSAITEGMRQGIVWDNHSNIPQAPVKILAQRLLGIVNPPGASDPLDTVLLGVCTGSVACAAALKIQLKVYQRDRAIQGPPVFMVLDGNYHGTDMVPQCMRGMWTGLLDPLEVIALQPNDYDGLEAAFKKHGNRVAGFWAEPVMMNREAIALERDYLQLARRWCTDTGALLCVDEIQTGFWRPEVFEFRALGIQPDLVIVGKGMTSGFHPLSAVVYKRRYDVLEQYDAISTNGSAALPSYVALSSLRLIQEQAPQIQKVGRRIEEGFRQLAQEFPQRLAGARGRGYLAGLKFHRVSDAVTFHRRALEAGLWTRVHAYHAGHSTLLTKLGLLANDAIVDFLLAQFRRQLSEPES
jgi:acetylornithine/succinyldiaminopimelate/putrescine aminotransferase